MQKLVPDVFTLKNEDFRNVSTDGVAVLDLGPGFNRLREHVKITGTSVALTDITNVELWLGGVKYRDLGSATDIDRMNQFHGLAAWHITNNPILTISHVREGLRRWQESMVTALGMDVSNPEAMGIPSAQLRFTLASAPSDVALESWAEVSQPTAAGMVLQERIVPYAYTSDGEKRILDLDQGVEEILQIAVYSSKITNLELWKGGRPIFQRSTAINSRIQTDGGWRTTVANLWVFDNGERGFGRKPLTVTPQDDFQIRPTLASVSGTEELKFHVISAVPYRLGR
jgi:hypothetical protein